MPILPHTSLLGGTSASLVQTPSQGSRAVLFRPKEDSSFRPKLLTSYVSSGAKKSAFYQNLFPDTTTPLPLPFAVAVVVAVAVAFAVAVARSCCHPERSEGSRGY
jgi:hypothetical protein